LSPDYVLLCQPDYMDLLVSGIDGPMRPGNLH
jgi:hypothetical protein